MAHVYADLVAQYTETTGTGGYAMTAAVANRRAFGAVLANGDTTDYQVTGVDASGNAAWEVGVGTYASTGATLARTTIRASSTGSAISWGPGVKTVTLVQAAGSFVSTNPANGHIKASGITPANGAIPIGNGVDFTVGTISGTANRVNVTLGAGTIVLSGPQDLHTGASPTFAGQTISTLNTPFTAYTDGTRTLNVGVDSANTSLSAFFNSKNGARFLANNGTVTALAYNSAGLVSVGSRTSAVNGESFIIAPTASSAVGATVKVGIANSGSGDGSPNSVFFGIDGPAFGGVGFLDTAQSGVAAATPVELRTGGSAQVKIIPTASANRCITLTGSNGGDSAISTSAGRLSLMSADNVLNLAGGLEVGTLGSGDRASYVDLHAYGAPNANDYSARIIRAAGTNGALALLNVGTGGFEVWNNFAQHLSVPHVPSANRYPVLYASNGGNPTISTSAGHLFLTSVGGGIVLTNLGIDPSSPLDGMLYYNNATNKFRGYAGGTWVDLH